MLTIRGKKAFTFSGFKINCCRFTFSGLMTANTNHTFKTMFLQDKRALFITAFDNILHIRTVSNYVLVLLFLSIAVNSQSNHSESRRNFYESLTVKVFMDLVAFVHNKLFFFILFVLQSMYRLVSPSGNGSSIGCNLRLLPKTAHSCPGRKFSNRSDQFWLPLKFWQKLLWQFENKKSINNIYLKT